MGSCAAVQAQLALTQFHMTDRMTRQQHYYLNLLEPERLSPESRLRGNTTPTATAVLLCEPVKTRTKLTCSPTGLPLSANLSV